MPLFALSHPPCSIYWTVPAQSPSSYCPDPDPHPHPGTYFSPGPSLNKVFWEEDEVSPFIPRLTLGCSVSTPSCLAWAFCCYCVNNIQFVGFHINRTKPLGPLVEKEGKGYGENRLRKP